MIPDWFIEQERGVKTEGSRWYYLWQPEWVYRWDRQKPIDALAVWVENRNPHLPALPGWEREKEGEEVLLFDLHNVHGHFTEHFARWAYKNIPNWYEQIAESLIRVFPMMKDAKIDVNDAPNGQRGKTGYIRFPNRTPLSVDHFGDGMRHTFKVLTALTALTAGVDDKRPGLFLWEDPELFMHPDTLGRLLQEVLRLTRNKAIQLFISTQSLEVVGYLTHHIQVQESYTQLQDQYRAFRLELDKGHSYVATFRFQNLKAWLTQGMDPRHWGVSDSPISYRYRQPEMAVVFPFGEGSTERVVFKFIQSKLYANASFQPFVSVGGKNNFKQQIVGIIENEVILNREVRILIFRDLDAGENGQSVAQSFQHIVM